MSTDKVELLTLGLHLRNHRALVYVRSRPARLRTDTELHHPRIQHGNRAGLVPDCTAVTAADLVRVIDRLRHARIRQRRIPPGISTAAFLTGHKVGASGYHRIDLALVIKIAVSALAVLQVERERGNAHLAIPGAKMRGLS